jgi:curved DNA-binding protein CbpA
MVTNIREHTNDFKERINKFIVSAQNAGGAEIKSEYIKLVKEFHPDVNRNTENSLANEYMVIINYIYEQLINKKTVELKPADEHGNRKVNGKYCFINEEGIKEFISDKTVYIYKLGKYEYDRAVCKCMKDSKGNTDREGYEITAHLYKSYRYFKEVIKLDKEGIWGKAAWESLHRAYEMNKRITRGLSKNDEKGLAIR